MDELLDVVSSMEDLTVEDEITMLRVSTFRVVKAMRDGDEDGMVHSGRTLANMLMAISSAGRATARLINQLQNGGATQDLFSEALDELAEEWNIEL